VDRRTFLRTLTIGLLPAPLAAGAQQAAKVPRVGVLLLASLAARPQQWEAFRQGLREHGYVEGQSILIDFRSAEGKLERLAELAAELVQAKADVIVASGTESTQAAQKATATIPIVMSNTGDPVGAGIVANLARPGGNVTGLSLLATELSAKRLGLLKEALPRLARVAVLWNPNNASVTLKFKETETAARVLGLQLQSLQVQRPADLEGAFQAAAHARADALVTADDQLLSAQRVQIVSLAMRYRLPVASEFREFAAAGGLMSYGPSLTDLARRAATYVDKILKGAKPGDLPVEQPTKFELLIKLKTAKALGLTIPQTLLQRADQMIE
jgi:putative ABC transport system substrate-binding protein